MQVDIPPDIATKLAGAAGAVVSMQLLKGSPVTRVTLALSGTVISFYFAPWLSHRLSLPSEVVGFLVGMFGMSILSKVWEMIQAFQLTRLITEWARKIMGLPPLPVPPPAAEPESKG